MIPSSEQPVPAEWAPAFSIIIPVRNAWSQLEECLDALASQASPPGFEVVAVDDGSEQEIPVRLAEREFPFPLRIERQIALGISAARNAGIRLGRGETLVFIDSDVVVAPEFLRRLAETMEKDVGSVAFQAQLVGGDRNLVERMEGMRLEATQHALFSGDKIRYANTSAFAVRRSLINPDAGLFDVGVLRGEDTLVLARLISLGELPRFVSGAVATHRPRIQLDRYLLKQVLIGYHTSPARRELEAAGLRLMHMSERRRILGAMWKDSHGCIRDRAACALIGLAHFLERCGRSAYWAVGMRRGRAMLLSTQVDAVRESELLARVTAAAECGKGLCVTYATAWTLVQAHRHPSIRDNLRGFDICYADGMGVVLASILLKWNRLQKVTANIFMKKLCWHLAAKNLRVGIVAAKEAILMEAVLRLVTDTPGLDIVLSSHGYLTGDEESQLSEEMLKVKPELVFVGMGQPKQEQWVKRMRPLFPTTVFMCVGGLFDYLQGNKPTPPRLVRRFGFEWMFILARQPRKYWRRYLIGLPLLGYYVVRFHVQRMLPHTPRR